MLSILATMTSSFRMSNKALYSTLIKPKSKQIITSNIEKSNIRMVVYWSIKSTFDLARYAVGSINSFQGTGVWSFIKFDREQKTDDEDEDQQITTIEPKRKSKSINKD